MAGGAPADVHPVARRAAGTAIPGPEEPLIKKIATHPNPWLPPGPLSEAEMPSHFQKEKPLLLSRSALRGVAMQCCNHPAPFPGCNFPKMEISVSLH